METLAAGSLAATFEEGAEVPPDVAETAAATEPLILEAVRGISDAGTVRTALGDLDRRLVATAALADERTLTLIEGYLLSRIDGTTPARQVLQLLPLDPEETERTLLGLVLTGRVEYRAEPAPQAARPPEPAAAAPTPAGEASEPGAPPAQEESGPLAAEADEAFPEVCSFRTNRPARRRLPLLLRRRRRSTPRRSSCAGISSRSSSPCPARTTSRCWVWSPAAATPT